MVYVYELQIVQVAKNIIGPTAFVEKYFILSSCMINEPLLVTCLWIIVGLYFDVQTNCLGVNNDEIVFSFDGPKNLLIVSHDRNFSKVRQN